MENFIIRKNISIKAAKATVFETLTNSEKLVKCYPLDEIITDWQVGSQILLKGTNNGQAFTDYGIIDAIKINESFQYSYWSDNHGTENKPENYLTISYTLEDVGKGTILKVEHRNFQSAKMYSEMQVVWNFLLDNLKKIVEKQLN